MSDQLPKDMDWVRLEYLENENAELKQKLTAAETCIHQMQINWTAESERDTATIESLNLRVVESSEAFSIVKKLHIKALEECVQLRRDIETWNIYAKESEARIAAAHASRDAEVKALQEKLAKYENAEPVAWRHDHGAENGGYEYYENASCPLCEPLFTHPKE